MLFALYNPDFFIIIYFWNYPNEQVKLTIKAL